MPGDKFQLGARLLKPLSQSSRNMLCNRSRLRHLQVEQLLQQLTFDVTCVAAFCQNTLKRRSVESPTHQLVECPRLQLSKPFQSSGIQTSDPHRHAFLQLQQLAGGVRFERAKLLGGLGIGRLLCQLFVECDQFALDRGRRRLRLGQMFRRCGVHRFGRLRCFLLEDQVLCLEAQIFAGQRDVRPQQFGILRNHPFTGRVATEDVTAGADLHREFFSDFTADDAGIELRLRGGGSRFQQLGFVGCHFECLERFGFGPGVFP